MRHQDAVADQIHYHEVRCFHGKQCPGGNQNGVSKLNLKNKRNKAAGKGGAQSAYHPSLYSFSLISTSRSRRKGLSCLFSQISASVIGGAARFTVSIRGPLIRSQREAVGGSGICTKVIVKYSIFAISCDFAFRLYDSKLGDERLKSLVKKRQCVGKRKGINKNV